MDRSEGRKGSSHLQLTLGQHCEEHGTPILLVNVCDKGVGPISLLSSLKLPKFVSPFGPVNVIATGVIIVITLLNIIVYKLVEPYHGSTQPLSEEADLGEKASNKFPLASELVPRRFSLPGILSATQNFDDSKVIGRGGFGKVYKGVLDDGAITVAIKRLNHMSKQGAVEFLTEIEMLSKFRHHNLISFIGFCDDCDEMILICIGTARGLEYLHTGTNVIHRYLKSSNILLDDNLTAKVSDFGISKIGPTNLSCNHVSTKIKGTRGYVDPEYILTHKLTKKSDVYSFGVVLFEVLSGRPAVDSTRPEDQWGLAFWAQRCIKEETINKIVDPNLRCQIFPNSLALFAKIANRYVHFRSTKRPTMAEVVTSLESALAWQERIDSSMFDQYMLSMGGNFSNQDIVDSSSEDEVIHSDSGQHLEEQIDNTQQKIVDYSSTLLKMETNNKVAAHPFVKNGGSLIQRMMSWMTSSES
ncbi:hypothetical protein LguiA_025321 [Lonicera macranthoides]